MEIVAVSKWRNIQRRAYLTSFLGPLFPSARAARGATRENARRAHSAGFPSAVCRLVVSLAGRLRTPNQSIPSTISQQQSLCVSRADKTSSRSPTHPARFSAHRSAFRPAFGASSRRRRPPPFGATAVSSARPFSDFCGFAPCPPTEVEFPGFPDRRRFSTKVSADWSYLKFGPSDRRRTIRRRERAQRDSIGAVN
jgi:hypothetical protein